MNWFKQLFTRNRIYSDLSEEIEQHLTEKVEALMASGMSHSQAEQAARREFGNVTRVNEQGREIWMWPRIEQPPRGCEASPFASCENLRASALPQSLRLPWVLARTSLSSACSTVSSSVRWMCLNRRISFMLSTAKAKWDGPRSPIVTISTTATATHPSRADGLPDPTGWTQCGEIEHQKLGLRCLRQLLRCPRSQACSRPLLPFNR